MDASHGMYVRNITQSCYGVSTGSKDSEKIIKI